MNWKQSAKAANKLNEALEETIKSQNHTLLLNKLDIRDYNKVIADMIAGESPCPMCEDYNECQLNSKGGKGCAEWLLRFQKNVSEEPIQEGKDESKGIYGVGQTSGN